MFFSLDSFHPLDRKIVYFFSDVIDKNYVNYASITKNIKEDMEKLDLYSEECYSVLRHSLPVLITEDDIRKIFKYVTVIKRFATCYPTTPTPIFQWKEENNQTKTMAMKFTYPHSMNERWKTTCPESKYIFDEFHTEITMVYLQWINLLYQKASGIYFINQDKINIHQENDFLDSEQKNDNISLMHHQYITYESLLYLRNAEYLMTEISQYDKNLHVLNSTPASTTSTSTTPTPTPTPTPFHQHKFTPGAQNIESNIKQKEIVYHCLKTRMILACQTSWLCAHSKWKQQYLNQSPPPSLPPSSTQPLSFTYHPKYLLEVIDLFSQFYMIMSLTLESIGIIDKNRPLNQQWKDVLVKEFSNYQYLCIFLCQISLAQYIIITRTEEEQEEQEEEQEQEEQEQVKKNEEEEEEEEDSTNTNPVNHNTSSKSKKTFPLRSTLSEQRKDLLNEIYRYIIQTYECLEKNAQILNVDIFFFIKTYLGIHPQSIMETLDEIYKIINDNHLEAAGDDLADLISPPLTQPFLHENTPSDDNQNENEDTIAKQPLDPLSSHHHHHHHHHPDSSNSRTSASSTFIDPIFNKNLPTLQDMFEQLFTWIKFETYKQKAFTFSQLFRTILSKEEEVFSFLAQTNKYFNDHHPSSILLPSKHPPPSSSSKSNITMTKHLYQSHWYQMLNQYSLHCSDFLWLHPPGSNFKMHVTKYCYCFTNPIYLKSINTIQCLIEKIKNSPLYQLMRLYRAITTNTLKIINFRTSFLSKINQLEAFYDKKQQYCGFAQLQTHLSSFTRLVSHLLTKLRKQKIINPTHQIHQNKANTFNELRLREYVQYVSRLDGFTHNLNTIIDCIYNQSYQIFSSLPLNAFKDKHSKLFDPITSSDSWPSLIQSNADSLLVDIEKSEQILHELHWSHHSIPISYDYISARLQCLTKYQSNIEKIFNDAETLFNHNHQSIHLIIFNFFQVLNLDYYFQWLQQKNQQIMNLYAVLSHMDSNFTDMT